MDEQTTETPAPSKGFKPFSSRTLLLLGLLCAGIVVAAFWGMCQTTPVPAAGLVVPAGAIAVTGNPPAAGGGPIPAGAMCAGGAGDTSNAPGARCWVIGKCTDTYHMQTGKCECRCI